MSTGPLFGLSENGEQIAPTVFPYFQVWYGGHKCPPYP